GPGAHRGCARPPAGGAAPPRRSELPKFFFCLHELLGHLRDDPVLLGQPLPKHVDLALQVSLLGAGLLRERRRAVLEKLLLPGIEQRGTHAVLLTHLRHRLPLQQDLPQDRHLVCRAVLPVSPCPHECPLLPADYTPPGWGTPVSTEAGQYLTTSPPPLRGTIFRKT